MKTLQALKLDYNSDSVEICDFGDQIIVACGTYELDEVKHRRLGRCYVYRLLNVDQDTSLSLSLVSTHDCEGILDMKWIKKSNGGEKFQLAIAKADGCIDILGFDENCQHISTQLIKVAKEDNILCLSIDFSDKCQFEQKRMLSCSLSDGTVKVFKIEDQLDLVMEAKAHDFEAWITAFNYFDTNLIYSGGDDCKLKLWDIRTPAHSVRALKHHRMGVTSMQHSISDQYKFMSGRYYEYLEEYFMFSYDQKLFVWDTRNWKSPVTEVDVGGGIWRIKSHPVCRNLVGTASMYNGFHIIDTEKNEIVLHYDKHDSIGYGIDWATPNTLVTSSFYDKALHLWSTCRF